jgi:hypothetical protein
MDALTRAVQPPIVTTGRERSIRKTHSAGRAAADDSPILHAAIGLAEQIRTVRIPVIVIGHSGRR